MKKLILILTILIVNVSYSQTDSTKKSLNCYVAGSISMSTGDNFKQNTYPSAEVGICVKNLAFGLNVGRSNIDKSPEGGEALSNYYYELKTMASFPIGQIKGYLIMGWGQLYSSPHYFIEYGGGIVYSIGNFDLMMQASNWNQIMYISPGIAYNFKL